MIIRTAFNVQCTFKIFNQILTYIILKLVVLAKIIFFLVIIPYLQVQKYYFYTCIGAKNMAHDQTVISISNVSYMYTMNIALKDKYLL